VYSVLIKRGGRPWRWLIGLRDDDGSIAITDDGEPRFPIDFPPVMVKSNFFFFSFGFFAP